MKESSKRKPKSGTGSKKGGNHSGRKKGLASGVSELSTVGDFCHAMQQVSPTMLAQSWDNVGLIAGDQEAIIRNALLAIDLSRAVLNEALRMQADILLTYHPPIFKPFSTLRAPGSGMESLVFECIRAGIALYSPHTALDAADGGTNDVLALACGAKRLRPLTVVDSPGARHVKIVVYVPFSNADDVANAMFDAGAGHIGKYSHCSFRAPGEGTFLGGPDANPTIGRVGRLERVDEIRLETIVPQKRLADVVAAMQKAHPYEEPAFDLFDLHPQPTAGIGRIGELLKPMPLSAVARNAARSTKAGCVQIVGNPRQRIERVIVVAGAAGSLPFQHHLGPGDCVVTGEMRHHDALSIQRIGCAAIVLGHWCSERPVLESLRSRLAKSLPATRIQVSRADADPFLPMGT